MQSGLGSRGHCKLSFVVLASDFIFDFVVRNYKYRLECGPMPSMMAALCSMPQSLPDAQYWGARQ